MKKVTLSINDLVTVGVKSDGNRVTKFKVVSVTDEQELKVLLNKHLHSTNVWLGGKVSARDSELGYKGFCSKSNYAGMTGVMLDFDEDFTLDEAREAFKSVFYVLYTTASHRVLKPNKNGVDVVCDRFRVILPFKPGNLSYTSRLQQEAVASTLLELYPKADESCKDAARKFFPHGTNEPSPYIFEVNDGEYYEVPEYLIEKHRKIISGVEERKQEQAKLALRKKQRAADKAAKLENGINITKKTFSKDTQVHLEDGALEIVGNIAVERGEQVNIYCPFCDDINSKSRSAFISKNPVGQTYIFCQHCQETFWIEKTIFDTAGSPLFYHHTAGLPCLPEANGTFKFFKKEEDWENFCKHSMLAPETKKELPRADIVFDLESEFGLDADKFTYNTFQRSPLLRRYNYEQPPDLNLLKQNTPRIYYILYNLLQDDKLINLFLNWIATTLQQRDKRLSAWVISTKEQGTGKDLLIQRVLKPIFGERHTALSNVRYASDKFNELEMQNWLQGYNEMQSTSKGESALGIQKLLMDKITAEDAYMEKKGVDKIPIKTKTNYMFFSNSPTPILLQEDDRRFFVSFTRSAKRISCEPWFSTREVLEAEIAAQVPYFAEYVQTITFNEKDADYAASTEAKESIISFSKNVYAQFVDALRDGDEEFFETVLGTSHYFTEWDTKSYFDHSLMQHVRDGYIEKKHLPTVWEKVTGKEYDSQTRQNLKKEGLNLNGNKMINGKQTKVVKP